MVFGYLDFGLDVLKVLGLALVPAVILAIYAYFRTKHLWQKRSSERTQADEILKRVALEVAVPSYLFALPFFGLIWLSALDSGFRYPGWNVLIDALIGAGVSLLLAYPAMRLAMYRVGSST